MLKAFIFLITLSLISSCEKNSSQVPAEFNKISTEFQSAWNKNDPQAFSNLWAEDADLITPWEKGINGKKEIEQHFISDHADTMKDTQMKLVVQSVTLIDPETAFMDADMILTGMIVGGEKADPFHDHVVFLLVKRDGNWKILIGRPY